eukprot:224175-Alexandrium_andersonii.AAC.1
MGWAVPMTARGGCSTIRNTLCAHAHTSVAILAQAILAQVVLRLVPQPCLGSAARQSSAWPSARDPCPLTALRAARSRPR